MRVKHAKTSQLWPVLTAGLLLAETLLCLTIVQKVPYTEIDLHSYFQQVQAFLKGQRDYSKIQGDTGPIVYADVWCGTRLLKFFGRYPAGHLYFYSLLYFLTNRGQDVRIAQYVFATIYLATLLWVVLIFRRAKVSPFDQA